MTHYHFIGAAAASAALIAFLNSPVAQKDVTNYISDLTASAHVFVHNIASKSNNINNATNNTNSTNATTVYSGEKFSTGYTK